MEGEMMIHIETNSDAACDRVTRAADSGDNLACGHLATVHVDDLRLLVKRIKGLERECSRRLDELNQVQSKSWMGADELKRERDEAIAALRRFGFSQKYVDAVRVKPQPKLSRCRQCKRVSCDCIGYGREWVPAKPQPADDGLVRELRLRDGRLHNHECECVRCRAAARIAELEATQNALVAGAKELAQAKREAEADADNWRETANQAGEEALRYKQERDSIAGTWAT